MTTDSQPQTDIIWIDDQYWKLTPVLQPLQDAGYSFKGIESYRETLNKIDLIKKGKLIILDVIIASGDPSIDILDRPYLGRELLEYFQKEKIKQPVIVFTVVRESEILAEIRRYSNVVEIFKKGERNFKEFTELAKSILKRPSE